MSLFGGTFKNLAEIAAMKQLNIKVIIGTGNYNSATPGASIVNALANVLIIPTIFPIY